MPIDANGDLDVEGLSLRGLPKVSLHDHLDGGVRPATVIDLADQAGIELAHTDATALGMWFRTRSSAGSLPEYLQSFDVVVSVMQTAESLRRISREFVEDLVQDGVVYGEVRWAPEQHLSGGLSVPQAIEAVQEGIDEAQDAAEGRGRSIRVGQILCAMRQHDRARDIAEFAVAYRDRGVVGFDIAGPEAGYPASGHRAAFDYLAGHLFPVTVHAGEAAGTNSIRSALIDARALRLGHGVRLAEDLEVVDRDGEQVRVRFGELSRWVRDREIPLELAPSSNLQTGAIAAWGTEFADHPFDLLYQLGFAVTVNTDNRTMSATSLTRELALLVDAFGYDLEDLESFQFNAAAAAFLPVEEREELIELIAEGFDE